MYKIRQKKKINPYVYCLKRDDGTLLENLNLMEVKLLMDSDKLFKGLEEFADYIDSLDSNSIVFGNEIQEKYHSTVGKAVDNTIIKNNAIDNCIG